VATTEESVVSTENVIYSDPFVMCIEFVERGMIAAGVQLLSGLHCD